MIKTFINPSEWVYFNRGNANVLYEYRGDNTNLKGKVLRLRLKDQQFDTNAVYEFKELKIKPLLDEVIDSEIVKVNFAINSALNDGYGLLMPNLVSNYQLIKTEKYYKVFQRKDGTERFLLELKPKWLQGTEKGCRNCAQHLSKHGEFAQFCVLGLLNEYFLENTIKSFYDHEQFSEPFIKYFQKDNNILKKLKNLQRIINFDTDSIEEICLQMTLRDLSIFLESTPESVKKVTITDVDPKSPSKLTSWIRTEVALNDYYNDH
ncbi:hypothetical protein WICMUC_005065 [Wickerhamomyces mucosus]|uniref:Inositol-pentakisphosphate 2-kinase n=1 Tax=Wickerhamomyces mucosus TaxID=1378264 RepID=A0A9P8PC56_9ASCO|nr:hypothetical protein WICMUC_005065 [Wickerhamomyces mucosus]